MGGSLMNAQVTSGYSKPELYFDLGSTENLPPKC